LSHSQKLTERLEQLTPERRALVELFLNRKRDIERISSPEPPVGSREALLANLWSRTLGIASIGRNENYFDLGGDSLQAIQIVAKARKAGIQIDVNQLFAFPTIAELAAAAPAHDPVRLADQEPGPVPLTPIQRWFFEQTHRNPAHWNQAVLLKVHNARPSDFLAAIRSVTAQYDVFRIRFSPYGSTWAQTFSSTADPAVDCAEVVVEGDDAELEVHVRQLSERVQTSLNLETGPLFRAVYIRCSKQSYDFVLIVCHHLVSDALSYRFLVGDLEALGRDGRAGASLANHDQGSAFVQWARTLDKFAVAGGFSHEVEYWVSQISSVDSRIPLDVAEGANHEGVAKRLTQYLDTAETRQMIRAASRGALAGVQEILFAAMHCALFEWLGPGSLLVDVEWHGRQEIVKGLDASRAFGWFTSRFPIRLDSRPGLNTADFLAYARSALRAVPNGGIGYGYLRYGSDATSIRRHRPAEVLFNYLGQFDDVLAAQEAIEVGPEWHGSLYDPGTQRPYILQVTAMVMAGRLQVNCYYSSGLHQWETAHRFHSSMMDSLRRLLDPKGARVRPDDFPDSDLTQHELDRLFG